MICRISRANRTANLGISSHLSDPPESEQTTNVGLRVDSSSISGSQVIPGEEHSSAVQGLRVSKVLALEFVRSSAEQTAQGEANAEGPISLSSRGPLDANTCDRKTVCAQTGHLTRDADAQLNESIDGKSCSGHLR